MSILIRCYNVIKIESFVEETINEFHLDSLYNFDFLGEILMDRS